MSLQRVLWCSVVGLAISGLLHAGEMARDPEKPNVLFILCDDLGINDLGCYGRKDHHTPHLDALATQGMRFTSAYCAQPICSPSRAAILTGKAPARLHLTTYLPGRPDGPSQKLLHPEIQMQLPLSEKMLPVYFKQAGYITAAIGKWHVGGPGFGPREHGFDFYYAGQANTKPSPTEGGKGEYDLTACAERFMETNQHRPFLIYLAHNTPHIPYAAQPFRVEHNTNAFEPVYAGVIETLDDTVGRLLAKLESLKLSDKTIVVFTSDNGGLHVPEGPHARVTHNTPYRAGKGFVYEGGLRIPLIVRWPGHIPAGQVTAEPVINTDWLPTLLELAGQPAPPGLDGTSLAGMLTAKQPAPTRKFFWHFPHYTNQGSRPSGAMREGGWMFIEYYDSSETELYDLGRDVPEKLNLAARFPGRVQQMHTALTAWRKEVQAQENTPNPDFDPVKFRELYIDVDASRFDPQQASPAQWESIWRWRKGMDVMTPGRKPNILWLVAEDLGPQLSCAGTKEVWTPHLDRLAAEGVRYTRFYNGMVCSPSRSAFMTGMYATTIGAHQHRTINKRLLPEGVRVLPDWMRQAGYFTANLRALPASCGFKGTAKTDWNFLYPGKPFDSDDWNDLKSHQPFYAQLNLQETHRPYRAPKRADPAKVDIPPYYPDHPVARADWANYLDDISELDRKIGRVLQQLEVDGLADNTVVVFFGDNGQSHVRGKQFCYEEGLHAPLIIRWPKKFPAPPHFQAGSLDHRLLEGIDLAPTMLEIAGASKPAKMQGRVFLGKNASPPRLYAFGARDRCDETAMRIRTVRDDRFRYIRNFTPEVPLLAPNAYKEKEYPVWNLLKELHAQGRLTPAQELLCRPRMPDEELYDLQADPHEIHNLAESGEPEHRAELKKLRTVLEQWIEDTDDQGRFPESTNSIPK